MNGIEAAEKAGPGGEIESPIGSKWNVDEDGDPYCCEKEEIGREYYPAASALMEDGWSVVRVGPEAEKVEPYKTPFVERHSQVCDADGNVTFNADRFNATVAAAYERGRREGLEAECDAEHDGIERAIEAAREAGRREGLPPALNALLEAAMKRADACDAEWRFAGHCRLGHEFANALNVYRNDTNPKYASLRAELDDEPADDPAGVAVELRERVAKLEGLLRDAVQWLDRAGYIGVAYRIKAALAEAGR